MAKKKLTSDELAELFLKEKTTTSSLKFETFCAKHGIIAHGQQEAVGKIIEEKTSTATSLDLEIFDREILNPKRFGFDFDGVHAFHGTYIGDNNHNPEPILIRSDRKHVRHAFFVERNLKFAELPQPNHLYGWRRDSIKQWLASGKTQNAHELYQKVRRYVAKYVYSPDPTFHDVVACFIMATHIWICFDAFPRLLITAKPDSGKSQLVRAIRNLCFNPTTTGDATKAALFRLANATAGVFVFDNFDHLPDEQKKDVMHFIELSYQNDLPVFRVEDGVKKGRVPTGFNVGVPLVAATIDLGAFSHAALTRSITLVMERCEEKIPELPDGKPSEDSNQLRQELYAWGLAHAPELREAAREFNCAFTARQAQIARPILYIASIVEDGLQEKILMWLTSNFESYHTDEEFSERVQVVRALYECVKGRKELEFSVAVKDVAKRLLSIQGVHEIDAQGRPNDRYSGLLNGKCQMVSANLGSIPMNKKKPSKGITCYVFQRDALLRYFGRFGLLDEVELQLSLSSNPSTPSIQSIPPLPSTPSISLLSSRHEQVGSVEGEEGLGGNGEMGDCCKLRFVKPVPAWKEMNGQVFGPYETGAAAELPKTVAKWVITKKLAEPIGGV